MTYAYTCDICKTSFIIEDLTNIQEDKNVEHCPFCYRGTKRHLHFSGATGDEESRYKITLEDSNNLKVGESIMKKLYSIYTPVGVVSTRGKLEDHEYPFAKAFKTKKEAKNYIDSNYIPNLRDYDIDEYNVYEDVSNIFSLDENVFDLDDKGNILYKGKAVLTPKDIQYRDVLEVINELLEDNELPKLSK